MNKYWAGSLVLGGSLGLLFGLGLVVTSADAWGNGCAGTQTFPATGQITSYHAVTLNGDTEVPDDGVVQAGGALSFTDNGDGTITDNNTGLMWESLYQPIPTNLLQNGDMHDWRTVYFWSCPGVGGVSGCVSGLTPYMTIWDRLDMFNETAFAGFTDWRVPNVKELMSIIDYGVANPAVTSEFTHGSRTGTCTPDVCSFTASKPNRVCDAGAIGECVYWTSTTVSPASNEEGGSSDRAFIVSFGAGANPPFEGFKTELNFVRFVRGCH